ncbi:hypothetical protein KM043_016736 [Ampulex compressa]|nr:hypothetical protein KM043_016736 [Ampulex compressa]
MRAAEPIATPELLRLCGYRCEQFHKGRYDLTIEYHAWIHVVDLCGDCHMHLRHGFFHGIRILLAWMGR